MSPFKSILINQFAGYGIDSEKVKFAFTLLYLPVMVGYSKPTLKIDKSTADPLIERQKAGTVPPKNRPETSGMNNPAIDKSNTSHSVVGNSRVLAIKYPLGRTITDSEGNKTKVKIIGKDSNSLFLIRQSDGLSISYPIVKLSEKDQQFFSFLPMKTPPPISKSGPTPRESGYLSIRENDLKRLKQQARSMRRDLVKNRKKLLIRRGIEGRLITLERQILTLEEQLGVYKASRGIPIK